MSLTWSEKKASMLEIVRTYFAPTLKGAGFVSSKDGFHWYKFENNLLYKVHLPIESPTIPVHLCPLYGVIPLFTWEPIAPAQALRDWPWELECDTVHTMRTDSIAGYEMAEQRLGALPRSAYWMPNQIHHLPNGLCVMHLMTDRWGAEVVDELIFPMLESFRSLDDIYAWHKENHLHKMHCSTDADFVEAVLRFSARGKGYNLSLSFADECLYLQDKALYPAVHAAMSRFSERLSRSEIAAKSKDLEQAVTHAKLLVSVIESGERALFDDEAGRIQQKMLNQIRKKLPDLKL